MGAALLPTASYARAYAARANVKAKDQAAGIGADNEERSIGGAHVRGLAADRSRSA